MTETAWIKRFYKSLHEVTGVEKAGSRLVVSYNQIREYVFRFRNGHIFEENDPVEKKIDAPYLLSIYRIIRMIAKQGYYEINRFIRLPAAKNAPSVYWHPFNRYDKVVANLLFLNIEIFNTDSEDDYVDIGIHLNTPSAIDWSKVQHYKTIPACFYEATGITSFIKLYPASATDDTDQNIHCNITNCIQLTQENCATYLQYINHDHEKYLTFDAMCNFLKTGRYGLD